MTEEHATLEIVRPADVPAEPWANGLGVTRVLATGPGWRISLAKITGNTPFSTFPGIDRALIPLPGSALTLRVGPEQRLPRPLNPVLFRGEDKVVAASLGLSHVVNVMTARATAQLELVVISAGRVMAAHALVVLGSGVSFRGEPMTPGTLLRCRLGGGDVDARSLRGSGAVAALRWQRPDREVRTGRPHESAFPELTSAGGATRVSRPVGSRHGIC